MPSFRGIEISVHTSLKAKQLPEYPHPDGSSVRLCQASTPPMTCDPAPEEAGTLPTTEDVDPTRLKKLNPRISVYIPSLAGEQFWLHYSVNLSPPPSKCIFFKMTMNGRPVSSWGINLKTCSAGVVVRALYQPTDKWGEESGPNALGYPGIETRFFHFAPGSGEKSVAEDGGVIEVQVFRCKGRKRIALELDSYRDQERYGITSPSGGLVNNPEDATYYNYYLVDAKDAPYATFCFHYRSMKHLKQLSLIPESESSSSPVSTRSLDIRKERSTGASTPRVGSPLLARRFTGNTASLESSIVIVDGADDADEKERQKAAEIEDFAEAHTRPLPEVPNIHSRPTSASSMRSNCPSLTPSLKQYVESDDFENEEIKLSTAHSMLITSESMQGLELVGTEADEDASISDYASSISSTDAARSPVAAPAAVYMPTTGSVLERQLTQYDSFVASSPTIAPMPTSNTNSSLHTGQNESQAGVLALTEAEWLRHTPSPADATGQRVEESESSLSKLDVEETSTVSDDSSQSSSFRNRTGRLKNKVSKTARTIVGKMK